jgi:ribosome biogenesis GTPase A
MTRALRMMEESIKLIDSVIYVLDSRAPKASINPRFDSVIGSRPVLYVLNKCDTVEKTDLIKWQKYYESKGFAISFSDSTSNRYAGDIIKKLTELNSELLKRYAGKGVKRSVRAMVIGVPNTGKSTLINSLCGGKRTMTGDKPGVTRGKQWISIAGSLDLLDTPGTMSPNIEDQSAAQHLAYIGSVKDDILDVNELALELIKELKVTHYDKLSERYKLTGSQGDEALSIMEQIGRNRGLIVRNAEVDYDRTAHVVIDDFRKRRIGKIMLEYPDA